MSANKAIRRLARRIEGLKIIIEVLEETNESLLETNHQTRCAEMWQERLENGIETRLVKQFGGARK